MQHFDDHNLFIVLGRRVHLESRPQNNIREGPEHYNMNYERESTAGTRIVDTGHSTTARRHRDTLVALLTAVWPVCVEAL